MGFSNWILNGQAGKEKIFTQLTSSFLGAVGMTSGQSYKQQKHTVKQMKSGQDLERGDLLICCLTY